MMGLHTMIVWSGMEIPGAQLILAGEFALVPAIRMKQQVSQERPHYCKKNHIAHGSASCFEGLTFLNILKAWKVLTAVNALKAF